MSWTTEFNHTLNLDGYGWINYSIRHVIPAAALSTGGSYVRIAVASGAAEGLTIDNVSIVEQSSGANGVAVPTELLFNGVSGFSIGAGAVKVSDPLLFTIDPTKSYIVVFDVANNAADTFGLKSESGWTYYYKSATNSYDQQNASGFTTASNYVLGLKRLEVADVLPSVQLGPFASAAWGNPYSQGAWR